MVMEVGIQRPDHDPEFKLMQTAGLVVSYDYFDGRRSSSEDDPPTRGWRQWTFVPTYRAS